MRVVRRSVARDAIACVEIIRGLPDFFTDEERDQIAIDLLRHDTWVIAEGACVIGFIVVERRSGFTAELLWMAVALDRRGQGTGTQILTHVLDVLAAEGVSLVEVKTLDQSADYEPYETTRAFWQQRGFFHIDTIDPMPGWPPGNPAALYVAALRPTVSTARRATASPAPRGRGREAAALRPVAPVA